MLRYLAAAGPAVIVLLLAGVLFRAGPTDFLPWWSDEVIYWNEVAAAGQSGVDTGYVTVQEQEPRSRSLRFGPHGPVYPLLYGAAARAAGWTPYSAYLVNLVMVTLGLAAFIAAGRDRVRPADLIAVALFWPLLLYLPTNMQEPMHFTIALLLAAVTIRAGDGRAGAGTWLAAGVVIAIAALARPTWALMIVPVTWSAVRQTRWRAGLAAASIAAAAMAQAALTYTSAPFPNAQRELIAVAGHDIPRAAAVLAARTWGNVRMLFNPANGDLPEVALRYLVLAVALALIVTLVRQRRTALAGDRLILESATWGLLLPLPAVLMLGWVESWRDFRMFAPHLLFALVLALPRAPAVRRLWWGSLVILPFLLPTFIRFHQDRFTTGHRYLDEMRSLVAPVIRSTPGADPWMNTVLVSAESLQHELVGLPPGISVSFVLEWEEMPARLKSRYLLLRPADEALYRGTLHVVRLADTPLGTLYRNRDAR